jgi:hypothetical protein
MALTLNGSTGLSGIVGSAGTPALQGGDTNTGYFFGTDILGLSTGGTSRLYITSDGKVGIGTESPSQKLVSEASSGYAILANGSANGIALGTNGAIVFGTKNIAAYAKGILDASEYEFKLSGSVNTYLKTTGLGIGVSPSATLHVNGVAKFASRQQYGGQLDVGASSNWWKIGTISSFGGGSAAKITILGTNSYGADDNCSGETTIILRRDNGTRVRGHFYGSGTTNSYLTIVDVATKATANSNEFDIWVKPGGHYANIATFVDIANGTWTDAPSDTGSTSQPTSSYALQKDWVIKTGGVSRLKVASDGDVAILDGDLVIGTDSHGINFSASESGNVTTDGSILDDYEEGQYIPTLTGSNSGSWTTSSYTYLAYTKIGRTVHVQGYLNISSESSPSGTCNISLPFTVNSSLSQNAKYPAICISLRSHNGSTNLYNVTGAPAGGTSYFQMVATAGNGVATWIGDAQIDGSWNVRIGGSYCV